MLSDETRHEKINIHEMGALTPVESDHSQIL